MGISLNTLGVMMTPQSPTPLELPEAQPEVQELFENAEACDRNGTYSTASEGYQKSADLGHTGAMVKLGDYFMDGRGMWKDERKAAELYERAAGLGNPSAMTKIGLCCLRGVGVEKDKKLAVLWYQRAADHNDPEGLGRLAQLYSHEVATPRGQEDEVEALLERAVKVQFPPAFAELVLIPKSSFHPRSVKAPAVERS